MEIPHLDSNYNMMKQMKCNHKNVTIPAKNQGF